MRARAFTKPFTWAFTNLGSTGEHPASGPSRGLRLAIAEDSGSLGEHPPIPDPTPTTCGWDLGSEGSA